MRRAIDISNYSELTWQQADFLASTLDIVVIGLQDAAKARDFYAKLSVAGDRAGGLEIQWYVDLPGRDLSLVAPGNVVWIDIEENCFQRIEDVRDEGTWITSVGARAGIYGNRTSISAAIGDSTELGDYGLPLWYANYVPPVWAWFKPFNGFQSPAMWQYTGTVDYCGVSCDLDVAPDL